MRILMINYEFPPIGGGGGNVTYYLSRNLALQGHEVHVITSDFKQLPKYEKTEGFFVHRVPVLRKNPNVCGVHEMLTFVVSASIYCLGFVKKFRPDIVHVFFGIPSGPVAYLLKKLYNLPYVLFLGGRDVPRPHPDPPFYRLIYGLLSPAIKSIWGNAKAVVACSSGLKDMALKTAGNINIHVIPDGVDLARFHPKEVQPLDDNVENNLDDKILNPPNPLFQRGNDMSSFQSGDGVLSFQNENDSISTFSKGGKRDLRPVKILAIGRLIPRKGFDCLIRSLPDIAKNVKNEFCVEIVGDGPLRSELKSLVDELHVSDKVFFAGSVPYEQLHENYQQADIFVLSSLAEGMPLVVLEAMASGLPIVATKVQGMDELVKVGMNGFLFTPSNHQDLSRHLSELILNNSIRQQMGKESLKIVKTYNWSSITEEYLNLYMQKNL
jgi:glycosyltransferase involved in cell wall biosynthesis